MAKSNEREAGALLPSPIVEVGICRPFSVTRLYSGPKPRTVTNWPSPFDRSIDTPVMRWSDSARLVSGNLPISSALIASTMPWPLRLMLIESRKLARMPVTTMSPSASPAAPSLVAGCGSVWDGPVAPMVAAASCACAMPGSATSAMVETPMANCESRRAWALRMKNLPCMSHGLRPCR